MDVRGFLGICIINLYNKSCVGLYKAGNGREPMIGDLPGTVNRGFHCS